MNSVAAAFVSLAVGLAAGAMVSRKITAARERMQEWVNCVPRPPKEAGRFLIAGDIRWQDEVRHFNVAHDDYSGWPETDNIAQANARTLLIALVATAKTSRMSDAIAAVDGVDLVWLGHYDMTNFIGSPGVLQTKIHAPVVW